MPTRDQISAAAKDAGLDDFEYSLLQSLADAPDAPGPVKPAPTPEARGAARLRVVPPPAPRGPSPVSTAATPSARTRPPALGDRAAGRLAPLPAGYPSMSNLRPTDVPVDVVAETARLAAPIPRVVAPESKAAFDAAVSKDAASRARARLAMAQPTGPVHLDLGRPVEEATPDERAAALGMPSREPTPQEPVAPPTGLSDADFKAWYAAQGAPPVAIPTASRDAKIVRLREWAGANGRDVGDLDVWTDADIDDALVTLGLTK